VQRTATIAASAATPAQAGSSPVDLLTARNGPASNSPTPLEDWFLAAALVALTLEAVYWTTRRRLALA
jgi:hypothetical protein